ncbi:MAG: alpha/beta fold hydrolase [Hyphomicrobiaceae bacterium]
MAPEQGIAGGISYLAAGPAGGLPVVFLHGIGGGAGAFTPQLEALSGSCRAIAWDMPGYGASTLPAVEGIGALAERLSGFLSALNGPPAVLVGHSIGGMIVQEYLARALGPARAVVLVGTSPAFGKPDGDWQREFLAARLGRLDAGRTMRELAPEMVAGLVGDNPDSAGRALAVASMAAVPEATYRAAVRSLLGFDRREALARIGVPTLLIAGTRDPNAPAPMMQRMADRISGARIVILEGAGHLQNLEQPAAFNAALGEFLATLPAYPGETQ